MLCWSIRRCRAKSRTTQHRPIALDQGTRSLDDCVAKRSEERRVGKESGKPFKAKKRQQRNVSSCRGAALIRLIIPPQRRDRWFKSSPRNQFLSFAVSYRVYASECRAELCYVGLSEDVARRVEQHNTGQSRWTKGRGPWTIVWQSDKLSLSEARKLENRLKRQKGGHGLFHRGLSA